MSTQDFKPGDRVKYVATDPDTTTPSLEGHLGTVAALDALDVEVEWDNPPTGARGVLAANLRKVDATQPEDATDLDALGGLPADDDTPVVRAFVESRVKEDLSEPSVDNSEDLTEPEPLKEGDWALVWAQIDVSRPDGDGDLRVNIPAACAGGYDNAFVRSDAIVRPDAGQVPPWVKPARCTSLYDSGAGNSLMRCEHEAGHAAKHVVGWIAWTDAEAYGRVEVSS